MTLKYKLLSVFFLLLTQQVLSQKKEISGTVTDNKKEPLPGVNIKVEGSDSGTQTDFDGIYSIEVEADDKLTFSFVGYADQTIQIDEDDNELDIIMQQGEDLAEVIVTGYTQERKADITGAVSIVEVEETKKQANPNPIQSLQGRVPGVEITTDGSPSGGNTGILIRGVGTLNNTDPLYVIDGVPTKGGMHELNPNDIESIQVLKDAASASIYGSRASNGVIVVTTKKGKEGRMRVELDHYTSFSNYANKLSVLDAEEFGQVMWQAYINDGGDPNSNNLKYNFDWEEENGKPVLNKITTPEYLDSEKTLKSANTDWFDEVSRLGIANSTSLSVSNGSEKGNYLFSLEHYDNKGIIKETKFKRLSARLNTSFNLYDGKLKIGENLTINRTQEVQDPGALDPALRALPIIPVRTVDGKGWGGPVGGMNDRQNPVRELEYNKDNGYKYLRLFGNGFVELNAIENLILRSNFGIDYSFYDKRNLQRSYKSGYLQNDETGVEIDHTVSEKWNWSNTAQYLLELDNHSFDLLGGVELFRERTDGIWSRKEDFLVETPDYMYPDAGTGDAYSEGSSSGYSLVSFFGKLAYEFKNKYIISGTYRYDGSSRFGKNERYGSFPSISASWKINEEDFIKNELPVISDLRLRAGWGQTGNQEIDNYASYGLYVADYGGSDPTWDPPFGTAYDLAGKGSGNLHSGFVPTQQENRQLKWETTTQTNIGFDFGLFSQKLTGALELYKKATKDILVQPAYLAIIGEGGDRWLNGASMENKGLEFSLSYRNTTTFDLNYNISGNIALNENKITHLPEDVVNTYGGNGEDDNILGRPINSIYGYVADGLFRTEDDLNEAPSQSGKDKGRIRYSDLNEDGKIDDNDRTWIGDPNPGVQFGLNINLDYKGFDITAFWQGIANVDVINDQKYQSDFWSVDDVGSNKGTRLLDAWSPDNPDSDIPALTRNDVNDENRLSTYFVENGSYLKLRNLQIGYSFQDSVLDKMGFENLRFYVSGQNLLTIKSKSFSGVDPEKPDFGYPIPTNYNLGINITL